MAWRHPTTRTISWLALHRLEASRRREERADRPPSSPSPPRTDRSEHAPSNGGGGRTDTDVLPPSPTLLRGLIKQVGSSQEETSRPLRPQNHPAHAHLTPANSSRLRLPSVPSSRRSYCHSLRPFSDQTPHTQTLPPSQRKTPPPILLSVLISPPLPVPPSTTVNAPPPPDTPGSCRWYLVSFMSGCVVCSPFACL